MFHGIIAFLSPEISLAVNITTQVILFRLTRRRGLLKSAIFGFAAGCLAFIIIFLCRLMTVGTLLGSQAEYLVSGLFVYALLGYCYFHFINMSETARRIRILSELREAPEGLSETEIMTRYSSSEIIRRRLGRLVDNGQLIFRDGRYRTKASFMKIITKILFLGRKLLIKKPRIKIHLSIEQEKNSEG